MSRVLILFSMFFGVSAEALNLKYVGETSLPAGFRFKETTVGGLSGVSYHDGKLYALSDDKGRDGEPRFYEFSLKIEKSKVELKPLRVIFISNVPGVGAKKPRLDPEGLVRLSSGEFLISSEGDNNAKPREMSRLFRVSAEGQWLQEYDVPEKFLPERTGQQSKGAQNNLAFEGLAASPDEKTVYVGMEGSLTQDFVSGEEGLGDWIRLIKYDKEENLNFTPSAEYAYRVDAFTDIQNGKELFRGVSEILYLGKDRLLVLERGVRLFTSKVWAQTVGLYIADLSQATNVSNMQKLSEKPFKAVTKTKIVDFESDLAKTRGSKKVQNFEGLAWGPTLPDGKRTLLVMSDNNFSKKDATELLVFTVEGE